ncbi:hypothetical protein [Luteipulveratus mongoliensis]|uniref:Uncharacterized protein n=1 Tax=Luteipulveratus mongoliensis TaxID=571913 RepID=A0A0K1JMX2_9MICO|nr:hypothetical protein [Luteipulveratus mongoliensis]AKU18056.1 hypothetical protein VV02_22970 [Luteipulveratus mongoliensis]
MDQHEIGSPGLAAAENLLEGSVHVRHEQVGGVPAGTPIRRWAVAGHDLEQTVGDEQMPGAKRYMWDGELVAATSGLEPCEGALWESTSLPKITVLGDRVEIRRGTATLITRSRIPLRSGRTHERRSVVARWRDREWTVLRGRREGELTIDLWHEGDKLLDGEALAGVRLPKVISALRDKSAAVGLSWSTAATPLDVTVAAVLGSAIDSSLLASTPREKAGAYGAFAVDLLGG